MKKPLLILLIATIFVACEEKPKQKEKPQVLFEIKSKKKAKYKEGDMVFLKPDSTQAVIADIDIDIESFFTQDSTEIKYKVLLKGGEEKSGIKEGLIYEPVKTEENAY